MIDWPLTISTISQAIRLAQDLRSIDKELSQAEAKLKIADLTTALADVKIALTQARDDAAEQQAEINRLKSLHKRLSDDTVEINGRRYRKSADGKPLGHSFCAVCLEKDGRLIETVATHMPGLPDQCPSCKALYGDILSYAG
jgi:hypothetical protein